MNTTDYPLPDDKKLLHCPALSTLKIISGKWKTRILWLLRSGAYHYGELKRVLPGISGKVLTEQIQQLEAANIVMRRTEIKDGVTYVFYQYTDYGQSLIPALDALGEWGQLHEARNDTAST